MSCMECENREATGAQIQYTDGSTETIRLCEACQGEFSDGGLIVEVTRDEPRRIS